MNEQRPSATSIRQVVEHGLCIGCGLCETVTSGRVPMTMGEVGAMRPAAVDSFTAAEEAALLAACPGVVAEVPVGIGRQFDPVWGSYSQMRLAWAGDSEVRFRASAGGVLTALGIHLLASGQVGFVLHIGQVPGRGVENRWVISETADDVLANCGSRYAPTAPLAGLHHALARGEAFAVIAKPCDVAAVRSYSRVEPRLDEHCVALLTMVCGGQSRITKTLGVLDRFGVDPDDAVAIRYRGRGNPGRTRIEDRSGRSYLLTYGEMWGDEGTWDLDARCTVCPDALGEAADIAVPDVFPGGVPEDDNEGFNAVVTYSERGDQLIASALASGALVVGDALGPEELSATQPHQVRKKRALRARLDALAAAGKPTIRTVGLRVDEIGDPPGSDGWQQAFDGTTGRIGRGRYTEAPPSALP